MVQVEYPDVDDGALLQRRAQRPVQAVLQVDLAGPGDRVREQIAVERRVLVEQGVQPQLALGGDQLVQPHLPRRNPRPVPRGEPVVGIGPAVPDILEDHREIRSPRTEIVGPIICWALPAAGFQAQGIGRTSASTIRVGRTGGFRESSRRRRTRITLGIRAVASANTEVTMSAEDRRFEVLRAIVADYVATHEPVGSRALVERHHLGVSPATIRNDMAVLEDEGYIAQPHTSAGRIPTDKGYRLFVDRLSQVKPLSVGGEAGDPVVPVRRRRPGRRAAPVGPAAGPADPAGRRRAVPDADPGDRAARRGGRPRHTPAAAGGDHRHRSGRPAGGRPGRRHRRRDDRIAAGRCWPRPSVGRRLADAATAAGGRPAADTVRDRPLVGTVGVSAAGSAGRTPRRSGCCCPVPRTSPGPGRISPRPCEGCWRHWTSR